MSAANTKPTPLRWPLAAVALLALVLVLGNTPGTAHATPEDAITYRVTSQPGSDAVLQVGQTVSFAVDVQSTTGTFTGPLTFTMKKPAKMTFAGHGVHPDSIVSSCADNVPAVGYVRCGVAQPPSTGVVGAIVLNFTVIPSGAGAVYTGSDIQGLFTDALSGFSDNGDAPDTGAGTDDITSLGGLTVANILGAGGNITIDTNLNPIAVVEGQLSTVTVTFSHGFAAIGPTLQPIEAKVTNADVQTGSVVCPGGGTGTVVSNVARCSGSTIANGSTMSFQVRALDTSGGTDATIVVTAPSLGLTIDETGTTSEGSARRTLIIDEVGLDTVGAAPPWAAGTPITICTANVDPDMENDQAKGAAQSASVFGTSTLSPTQPLAQGDFVVTGPTGAAVAFTHLAGADCGSNQSGLRFTPANAGAYTVTARYNGDTTSDSTLQATRGTNTLALAVQTVNPVPSVTNLNPNIKAQGQEGFTLTVTGTNFVPGSIVRWDGVDRTTIFDSVTQLRAIIPAADISDAGMPVVTVWSPGPGGGVSPGGQPFTITTAMNPVPQVTSLTPSSVQAGVPGFTLTVRGAGFVPDSRVSWNGSPRATTYISAAELRIDVLNTDIATAGNVAVAVVNPLPGGGTSLAASFTVTAAPGGGGGGGTNNPVPTLTTIAPATAPAGSADVTITLTGTNYITGSVVRWNGAALATTRVSATQLTAVVPAAKLAAEGSAQVSVFNPTPGGGESVAKKTFTIGAPGVIETEELAGIAVEGFVSRSRLTFAATTGDLELTAVSFVIERASDGKYWNGTTGAWQDDEFENEATESGVRWEYAVTGVARRQFVATTVNVDARGAKGSQLYAGEEPVELRIR